MRSNSDRTNPEEPCGQRTRCDAEWGKVTIETANIVLDEDYVEARPEVETGSYVMFSVSDSGQGIESETMTLIFDPFFTTKEKGLGTVLGSRRFTELEAAIGVMWAWRVKWAEAPLSRSICLA